jgi:hypothetical protein
VILAANVAKSPSHTGAFSGCAKAQAAISSASGGSPSVTPAPSAAANAQAVISAANVAESPDHAGALRRRAEVHA